MLKNCAKPPKCLIFMVLFIVLPGQWGLAQDPKGLLVTKVVGTVGEHVVTSREVQMSYLVEQALSFSKKDFEKRSLPLKLGTPQFAEELKGLFLEWVIFFEARNFSLTEVKKEDKNQAEKSVLDKLSKNASWKELAPSKKELDEMIERKLRSKKFVQFKSDASVLQVSDQEAEDYFNRNRNRFGSLPFESFRERIKEFIKRKRKEERLDSWFKVLQNKYHVRSLLQVKS